MKQIICAEHSFLFSFDVAQCIGLKQYHVEEILRVNGKGFVKLRIVQYILYEIIQCTYFHSSALTQSIPFTNCSIGRAIAQAVSRRLPTAAARVQTRV
jgi:hypothetical protein